jgi:hypothetical protein
MAFDSLRRDVARSLRIRLADDLGWELEELTARGVRAAFFFARGDAGVALLKLQAGSALRRLRNRCHIHCVDGADHIFSQSAPRALLERLLEQELIGADPSVPFSGAPPRPHSGPPRERPLHRWRARHLKTA